MTQFTNPPEIEELSELGWKRVEQSVFQANRHLEAQDRQPANVSSASAGQRRRLWVAGLTLAAVAAFGLFVLPGLQAPTEETVANSQRSRIETQSSPSEVYIGAAAIEVSPQSAIWIDRLADDISVTVDEGGMRLRVESDASPMQVHAGDVRIEVMSTDFSVFRQANRVNVEVAAGSLILFARGNRITLEAGDTWPVPTATAAPSIEKPRPPTRSSKQKKKEPSPRSLFQQATELEASAPEAAIALYKQVAKGSGAWAANALFAQGRLHHARGEQKRARAILAQYLQRFPEGPNAADAKALLAP
jgi:TolA-binding protein